MRLFTADARYQRFIEANLALTLAEIQRDKDRREDEDPRVQRMATVPDAFLDPTASGRLTILVGIPDADPSNTPEMLLTAGATV